MADSGLGYAERFHEVAGCAGVAIRGDEAQESQTLGVGENPIPTGETGCGAIGKRRFGYGGAALDYW